MSNENKQPDERAAFEAWKRSIPPVHLEETALMWLAWQARATAPQATLTKLAESNANLRAQIERYQATCASAYQLAGAVDAPLRFLDALSAASNGEPVSEEAALDLLPVTAHECAGVPRTDGNTEDAERYRWLRRQAIAVRSYADGSPWWEVDYMLPGESFDAAIDAARKAEIERTKD